MNIIIFALIGLYELSSVKHIMKERLNNLYETPTITIVEVKQKCVICTSVIATMNDTWQEEEI